MKGGGLDQFLDSLLGILENVPSWFSWGTLPPLGHDGRGTAPSPIRSGGGFDDGSDQLCVEYHGEASHLLMPPAPALSAETG
jgi:hypothetical protein